MTIDPKDTAQMNAFKAFGYEVMDKPQPDFMRDLRADAAKHSAAGSTAPYALLGHRATADCIDIDVGKLLNRWGSGLKSERAVNAADLKTANNEQAILSDLYLLLTPPFVLSRTRETLAHSALMSAMEGKTLYWHESQFEHFPQDDHAASDWRVIASATQVFCVEHDWRAAFAGSDLTGGDIRLPAEFSIFEFVINKIHLCYMLGSNAVDIAHGGILFIKTSGGWIGITPKQFPEVNEIMAANVRAICIALDAAIATTEVVRAPHKINRVREAKGRLPIFDFHSVRLTKRSRPMPLPVDPDRAITRRRLHFRRGHWRHFDDHKTWINWMLVGDPDLGFVDKNYRL